MTLFPSTATWRLPTGSELRNIYKEIYKKNKLTFSSATYDHGYYWSSEETNEYAAGSYYFTPINFGLLSDSKSQVFDIRLVRSFN